jgi:hypothetical protein
MPACDKTSVGGFALIVAFVAGCSAAGPSDAAIEAPSDTANEAPMDAATEAPSDIVAEAPTDTATEAPQDNAVACPTLESYCATNHCVTSWSDADQPSAWCTTGAGASFFWGYANVYIQADCGGFDVVLLAGTDTGTFNLYDRGTGKLIGVGSEGLGWFCLAGTIPTTPLSFACLDGGVSASVCGP